MKKHLLALFMTVTAAAGAYAFAPDADNQPAADGTFTMDMIKNWTGSGANQAAFVAQWNQDTEYALVFGYRWDGEATAAQMLQDIVKNNPRLYGMWSPAYSGDGFYLNGLCWDDDDDEFIGIVKNGKDLDLEQEGGWYRYPQSFSYGEGSSFSVKDIDDIYGFSTNWQGYKKSSAAEKMTSGYPNFATKLTDGMFFGVHYYSDMDYSYKDPLPLLAAPSNVPAGAKTKFVCNNVCYTLRSYKHKTVEVAVPWDGIVYSGEVTIPATFTDEGITYTVEGVAESAFASAAVTSVVLPSTVTALAKDAFAGCSKLASVDMPGVNNIGAGVFSGCAALTAFKVPEGILAIPDDLYKGTGITSVEIPASVTKIGSSAFAGCTALATVFIPKSCTEVGAEAFSGCTALVSVKSESTVPPVAVASSFPAGTGATLFVPDGYTAQYQAAEGWKNFSKIEEYALPVLVGDRFIMNNIPYEVLSVTDDGGTVKVIANPFEGGNDALTGEARIPASVTFQRKNLKVTELTASALKQARNITSLVIEAEVTDIPESFCQTMTKLVSVVLPEGLRTIGKNAFFGCSALTSLNLPSTLTDLGAQAFKNTKITSLTVPASVKELCTTAFSGMGQLESITLPEGLTAVGAQAFNGCAKLTEIRLPQSVTTIGASAFVGCRALTTLVIPDKVTVLPANMLQDCVALTSFTVPAQVTELGAGLFKGCSNILTVDLGGVTTLPKGLFETCSKLSSVKGIENVTVLGDNTFNMCRALTTVILNERITKIPDFCFNNCSALDRIEIPEGVTVIGRNAFAKCVALPAVKLPAGVTAIGSSAFDGCTLLDAFEIPVGMTSIPSNMISNTAVSAVTIPDAVTSIGNYAFSGTKITNLEIPASVTSLGNYFIQKCPADIVLWMVSSTPVAKCTYNTFSLPSYYPTVYVPEGTIDTYREADGWKYCMNNKISSIHTVPVTGFSVNAAGADVIGKDAVIEAAIADITFDPSVTMPERFAAANTKAVAASASLSVSYQKAGDDAPLTADFVNGCATLAALADGTYTYTVTAKVGELERTSPPATFVIGSSAITDIEASSQTGARARVFDLTGRQVTAATLAPGVYVKVYSDGRSCKFVVK